MFTDRARQVSRGFVEPVALAMGRVGLTPNGLTLLGSAMHLVVAWLIATGHLPLGGIALVVTAAFDGFDGTLARLTGRASNLGAFLDSTFDRISEILVFCGLLIYALRAGMDTEAVLVLVTLAFSLMVSYTRARSEALGCGTKVGVFGRLERMAVLSVGLIVSPWIPISWTLWLLAVGVIITTGQRIVDVYRRCGDVWLADAQETVLDDAGSVREEPKA
jgi:CDP-diacylglycerol--glycerol-3-phosphate 3-phosphatidyltransferase